MARSFQRISGEFQSHAGDSLRGTVLLERGSFERRSVVP